MKTITLFLLSVFLLTSAISQEKNLKGDGQIFWEENFDWEDPDNPSGWDLPDGWLIEDNSADDNGFVWTWTKDSLQGPFSRRDGGYILNSSTGDNGFLAIDLDNHNAYKPYGEMLYVNSSITLPKLDCSEHPSVIIGLEQMFKYFNNPTMAIEVSNDDGAHWAAFDMKMGTGFGTNTLNLPNDGVAYYTANLSDVAAGQSNVTIKITWNGSMLYFWMLDDIIIYEGWDYDLKMNHWDVELVDDNPEESAGFMYMMPKTQILPMGGFEGSVINYGDNELYNIQFNVTINKNHVEQFNESSESIPDLYFGDPADTLSIEEEYTPVDFGHYEIQFKMTGDTEDQFPENNSKSYYFHVTDSVFARTPDVSEADESPWRDYYQYTHEGDIMGVEFNPLEDCTANSISVYIAKANMNADFKYVLLEITEEDGDFPEIKELITSDLMWVDEEVLEQGWITLQLDPDGIGENMKAGGRYIAGVQFWTYIEESDLVNRGDAFWIGSTRTYPDSYDKQWLFESSPGQWTQGSNFNKMIRLNIDNHENILDGIPMNSKNISLGQNYPNPFNSETQIEYSLTESEIVRIDIQDITGRTVKLIEEGFKPAGNHYLTLQSTDLEAGVYFYTLKAGQFTSTKKMTVR